MRRAVERWEVALGFVIVKTAAHECCERLLGGGFTGFGNGLMERMSERRRIGRYFDIRRRWNLFLSFCDAREWRRQTTRFPSFRVRGKHCVGLAGFRDEFFFLANDGVFEQFEANPCSVQSAEDAVIAGDCVRFVALVCEDGDSSRFGAEFGNLDFRFSGPNDERITESVQVFAKGLERLQEKGETRGSDVRPSPQRIFEDENRQDVFGAFGSLIKGGVVADAQVAPKPVNNQLHPLVADHRAEMIEEKIRSATREDDSGREKHDTDESSGMNFDLRDGGAFNDEDLLQHDQIVVQRNRAHRDRKDDKP